MSETQIYLLSEKESRYYTRVNNIILKVLSRPEYIGIGDDGKQYSVIWPALDTIRAELEHKKVSIPALTKKISAKMSKHYFTIGYTADKNGKKTSDTLRLLTDNAPVPGVDIPADNPIYTFDNPLREETDAEADYWRARRADLDLPDDCYYLNANAWIVMRRLDSISSMLNGLAPKKEQQEIFALTEIKPENAVIPHTNLVNHLSDPALWGGKWQQMRLPGFPLPDGPAKTYFALAWDIDEGEDIQLSRKITPYEKSVLGAAMTLFAAGNEIITERQVIATMKAFQNDNSGIDAAAIDKAVRAIDKERRIMAKINATKSFEQRGITDLDAEIETYLLPLEKVTVKAKGKRTGEKMTAYRFMREPPVLTHARAIGQLYTVPMKYMQIVGISATDSVVSLRDFLIRRIEAIKGGKLSPKILYSTVYTEMELVEPSPYNYSGNQTRERTDKTTKEKTTVTITKDQAYKEDLDRYRHDAKRIRDQVKVLMENWKKQGYIKGYSEVKKGKTIEAVTVRY